MAKIQRLERERRRRREGDKESEKSIGQSKSLEDRCVEGTLHHLYRTCIRPSVSADLQAEVVRKLGVSRRALGRGAGGIEIIKPLYDLIDSFHQKAYQISNDLQDELAGINSTLKEASEHCQEDYIYRVLETSRTPIQRDIDGYLLKKQLENVQNKIKALSDYADINFHVKNAARRIQRERPYLTGDILPTQDNLERDVQQLERVEELVKTVEAAELTKFPNEVSSRLKVCLARTRRALMSASACRLLMRPLHALKDVISSNNEQLVQSAINKIHSAINNYDTS